MKKPELQDFGISPVEYALYREHCRRSSSSIRIRFSASCLFLISILAWVITFLIARNVTKDLGEAIVFAIVFMIVFGVIYAAIAEQFHEPRELPKDLKRRINVFREALAAFAEAQREAERAHFVARQAQLEAKRVRQAAERAQRAAEQAERRKRIDYWRSLRATKFEDELANLFKSMGYSVQTTSRTGDHGIDLIIKKDGKTTIVQCKGQNNRATPEKVRELSGSRDLFKARHGYSPHHTLFACTEGYTQGAKDTAKLLNISLVTATEIARMAEGYSQPQQDQALTLKNTVPKPSTGRKCPQCGHQMTLQSTKYDRFWRCSKFPKCKAIQNVDQSGIAPTISTSTRSQAELEFKQQEQLAQELSTPSEKSSAKSHAAPATQARDDVTYQERLVAKEPNSRLPTGPQCPTCGSAMALMDLWKGRYGMLWGCPRYPECKGARDLNRRVLRY